MTRTWTAMAGLAAVTLATWPACAQAPDAYPQCTPIAVEGAGLAMRAIEKEAEEERLLQRIARLRRAAVMIPAQSPEALRQTAQSLRGVAEGDHPADPGEAPADVARRRENAEIARALLDLVGQVENAAGTPFDPMAGAFGRRIAGEEAARRTASAALARLLELAEAKRQEGFACLRRAGAPWMQGPPTQTPSNPGAFTDVSGQWLTQLAPDEPQRIVTTYQTNDMVSIDLGGGALRLAFVRDGGRLVADEWRGGLVGRLSADRREVRWSNGMVWRRR